MPANEAFLHRLSAADRVWQSEKARALWWRAVPFLLGFILLAFGVDAFLQLGRVARVLWIVAVALAALVTFSVGWYLGWLRRNPAERTARFLEQRDPGLGSRLINTIQLSELAADTKLAETTRSIASRAVDQAGGELNAVNFAALARTGESRRRLRHAGFATLLCLLLLAAFYPVTSIILPRFLDPFGDHPPYAFTRLDITDPGDAGVDVTYGGSLQVRVAWSGHEPHELYLSIYPKDGSAPVTLPMIRDGDKGFVQQVSDIRADSTLMAHSKGNSFYSRRRDVHVILTPQIEKAFIEITPPAYTGLKTEEQPFDFKSANALEGSQLRFRLQSNRPLRKGAITLSRNGNSVQVPMSSHGEKEVSGAFILRDDASVRFQVTDVAGIVSEQQPEALISVLHDLPPTVSIVAPEQDGFASVDYKLNAKIEANDDYGVKTLRIHRALNGIYSAPFTYNSPGIQRDVAQNLMFDFSDLGVKPGDRVSLFAEAIDTAPTPHVARSQTVTLTMISAEDYNEYLRQQNDVRDLSGKYDDLLRQFLALRDDQSKLADDAAALRNSATGPKSAAAHLQDFDNLAARQNELNQRLDKLAARMQQFVRPHPVYDFERDLQRELTSEANQIRQSTARNEDALDKLAKQTSNPDGSRSLTPENIASLQSEAKAQAGRLGARDQEMRDAVSKPLDDLSKYHDIVNDFNAFQQACQAQQALAEQTRAYQNKGALTREDQLALKDLAAQQEAVRQVLDELPADLRDHAQAAQPTFPKAAASAMHLADAIEAGRFEPTAASAADRMLDGDGEQGSLLAQRLDDDMRKLFSQCNGSGQQDSDELDQYLSLHLNSGKGNSFQQMRESLKFGMMGSGHFPMMGRGQGPGGTSGYSMNAEQQPSVLGNEQFSPNGPKKSSKLSSNGSQAGGESAGASSAPHLDSPEVMKGLNPTDRRTDSVHSEGEIEEYRPLVDQYFKTITHQ